MKLKQLVKRGHAFAKRYCVSEGNGFRLKQIDPADTGDLRDEDKARAKEALAAGVQALAELQERLYAQDRWAVLIILQAMDAAGKDSAIEHVMSGVNPQGCQVSSFKAPSAEELDHDFMWRCVRHLPERGRIGIFNRSYYEETLIVRVHQEHLERQRLPRELVGKNLWSQRFEDIRHFERYLSRNGVLIRKFFLHVSKKEQQRRFLSRIEDPKKQWKFALGDVNEREFWEDYMNAYQETIQETATEYAPWYVVPADNKWFTRLVVAAGIIDALWSLDLDFPKLDKSKRKELEAAREALLAEKGS